MTGPNDAHLLRNLVLFSRGLRNLGVAVGQEEIGTLVTALGHVDLGERRLVRDAARSVLVHHREHLPLFDHAFDLFWRADIARPQPQIEMGRHISRGLERRQTVLGAAPASDDPSPELELDEPWIEARRSSSERDILRRKDFAELTGDELRQVRRLLREQVLRLPPRRTRRLAPSARGARPDLRRSLRASLRFGGELLELVLRDRTLRRRPLVVIADVSGSMESYARIFLEFIYTLGSSTDRLEAFVFGTRLTRITRQLAHRDPERALRAAADAIVDWGGGTRIGRSLRSFNYEWGRRVLGQGAIVAVISDGWERDDVGELEREVARLARSCGRLLWLNPLIGSPGYQPLSRGIRAVLPHVDDFLPVHNLESLEQLATHLAKIYRGKAGGGLPARRKDRNARRSP